MTERHTRYHRYILAWSLTVGGALLMISLINWIMDPYRLFSSPVVAGVNAIKPEIVKADRMAKTQMILRVAPDALILGNSRSLNGIPTTHPAWSDYTVFNAALTGGRIEEALDFLRFAHGRRPIRRVLLNIDELNFRSGVDPTVGANPHRFKYDTRGDLTRAIDRASALFTDRGLRASLRTWNARHGNLMESDAAVILEDGSIDQELFYRAISARGGAREAFRRVETWSRASTTGEGRSDLAAPSSTLLEMLRFARLNGIDISIYFPPLHARALAGMQLSGTLDELLWVRRSVLDVVTREAAESGRSPVRLFDFVTLNGRTMEPIPAISDHAARMVWFFEGSHFTQNLGGQILDCIYLERDAKLLAPKVLTPQDSTELITTHNSLIRSIGNWSVENPQELDELVAFPPR
jgi:hypothetical protein